MKVRLPGQNEPVHGGPPEVHENTDVGLRYVYLLNSLSNFILMITRNVHGPRMGVTVGLWYNRTKKLDKPIAQHVILPNNSIEDLTVMVIEKIIREDTQLRKRRGRYWIHHLRAMASEGLKLND